MRLVPGRLPASVPQLYNSVRRLAMLNGSLHAPLRERIRFSYLLQAVYHYFDLAVNTR